jgi:hypothetical protein
MRFVSSLSHCLKGHETIFPPNYGLERRNFGFVSFVSSIIIL